MGFLASRMRDRKIIFRDFLNLIFGIALSFSHFAFCQLVFSEIALSENSIISAEATKSITPNQKILDKFFPNSFASSFNAKSKPIEIKVEESNKEPAQLIDTKDETNSKNLEFQTSDVTKKSFLPPDQTPAVPVNPDAPSSIISMIESNRRGDQVGAKAYAKQFVRMLQNYFFEVKEMTSLIGDALIEESVVKDEDWVGASQAIDIEFAKTRLEKGISIKPTHDVAMKRIVPDPKKEVEAYFIFSRSNTDLILSTITSANFS